jgi:glucose/arabinose dehydrogenase
MDTANDDSGRMFFAEQLGKVRVRQPNGTFGTFLDISSETLSANGQRGLLGMAFHPGFADPQSPGYRKFYTYHSVDPAVVPGTPDFASPGTVSHDNLVTEWQVDANNPNVIDLSTRREVFREAHIGGTGNIHSGGMLDFGPDGYLYGTIGTPPDGTALRLLSQDLTSIQGKIFRIDPLAPASNPTSTDPVSANGKYRTPANNPFVDTPSTLDEIYALGIRHAHRFGWDTANGNFFVGDVGDGAREEIDVVHAGDNFGYPYFEGNLATAIPPPVPSPTFVAPMAEYSHADGRTVVGGYVYRGSIEALQGTYIAGEFSWAINGNQSFLCCAGRLFFTDPYDSMGELKDPADVRLQEALLDPATCADTLSPSNGCTFASTLFSLAVDDDGEIYALGSTSSKAVVYKITGAYFLPEGDYNEDGKVDAADYTVWRNTLGESVLYQPISSSSAFEGYGSGADGDGDGVIDVDDYAIWKAHFGEFVNIGSGAGSLAVPEPTSLLVAVFGCAIGCAIRRVRCTGRAKTSFRSDGLATT